MSGNYKAAHLIVSGIVQGVGFRYYVLQKGRQYEVSGWVRNLSDGNVEIRAEGDSSSLNGFIDEIKIGPSQAHISDVKIEWLEYTGEMKDFRVGL